PHSPDSQLTSAAFHLFQNAYLPSWTHHAATCTLFPYTTLFRSPEEFEFSFSGESDFPMPDDAKNVTNIAGVTNFQTKLSLEEALDRKSTRLNSSHVKISYAVFGLKNKITRHRGISQRTDSDKKR